MKNSQKLNVTEIIKLQIDTIPVFTDENTVAMMLQTRMENYELAMALNDAFGLKLTRRDCLTIQDETFPYFTYCDEDRLLAFLLVNGTDGALTKEVFAQYDKMLLIRGRDAKRVMKEMYDVMVEMPLGINVHDMLEYTHYRYVETLISHLFKIECFSFGGKHGQTKAKKSTEVPKKTVYATVLHEFALKVFNELNMLAYEEDDSVFFISDEKPVTKIEVG